MCALTVDKTDGAHGSGRGDTYLDFSRGVYGAASYRGGRGRHRQHLFSSDSHHSSPTNGRCYGGRFNLAANEAVGVSNLVALPGSRARLTHCQLSAFIRLLYHPFLLSRPSRFVRLSCESPYFRHRLCRNEGPEISGGRAGVRARAGYPRRTRGAREVGYGGSLQRRGRSCTFT